jgi:hypothetical protein
MEIVETPRAFSVMTQLRTAQAFLSVRRQTRSLTSGAEGYRFEPCRGYLSSVRTYDNSLNPLRTKLRTK